MARLAATKPAKGSNSTTIRRQILHTLAQIIRKPSKIQNVGNTGWIEDKDIYINSITVFFVPVWLPGEILFFYLFFFPPSNIQALLLFSSVLANTSDNTHARKHLLRTCVCALWGQQLILYRGMNGKVRLATTRQYILHTYLFFFSCFFHGNWAIFTAGRYSKYTHSPSTNPCT